MISSAPRISSGGSLAPKGVAAGQESDPVPLSPPTPFLRLSGSHQRFPRHCTRVALQAQTKVTQETCPFSFNTPMVQRAEAENFDFSDASPRAQGRRASQPPRRGAGTGSLAAQGAPGSGDTQHKEKGLYKT